MLIMFANLNKNVKTRLKAAQNKCIRFCLKLGDRKSITVQEFEKLNWMPIHERVNQWILSCVYKFLPKKAPNYMDQNFSHAECNGIPTRYSYQKLTPPPSPHSQKKSRLRALSYIGPSLWSNQDRSLKTSTSLNPFKHNIKAYYFRKGDKKES